MYVAPTTHGSTRRTFLSELTKVVSVPSPQSPSLFLIPNLLGDAPLESSLPPVTAHIVGTLQHFVVEEEKSARALIKTLCPQSQIRTLSILRIPDTPTPGEVEQLMAPIVAGHSIGVISEAGCPGIADPGAPLVNYAHAQGIRVIPLVGPCSMMLALMASGLNGQAWRFVGYLPIDAEQRAAQIRALDEQVRGTCETQIIMETPYRSDKLLHELIQRCAPTTRLCVAQALTTPAEFIKTQTIRAWRNDTRRLEKLPCLFLLGGL